MNLGIYINSLGDAHQMKYISQCINSAIDNNKLTDASIFYNDVGYNPFDIKCGTFNSTDIWNFSGSLIATSLQCLSSAHNIVNNIQLYYYYGWEKEIDILELLDILAQTKIKVICNSEDDAKEFYRITGNQPEAICSNYDEILTVLQRCNNGCSKNCKNVCRAK